MDWRALQRESKKARWESTARADREIKKGKRSELTGPFGAVEISRELPNIAGFRRKTGANRVC